jgi:hypothetical protein
MTNHPNRDKNPIASLLHIKPITCTIVVYDEKTPGHIRRVYEYEPFKQGMYSGENEFIRSCHTIKTKQGGSFKPGYCFHLDIDNPRSFNERALSAIIGVDSLYDIAAIQLLNESDKRRALAEYYGE